MRRIGVTEGLATWYAVLYETDPLNVIEIGIGRYATRAEAAKEAIWWAEDEGVELEPEVREYAKAASA